MARRFISLCLILSFLIAISCAPKRKWQTSTFIYFDTICQLKILCPQADFNLYEQQVRNVFSEIEALFSPEANDLTHPLVLKLFSKAFEIYKNSNGDFDITVGPLSKSWGFLNHSYRIPSKYEISQILPLIGMNKIKKEKGRLVLKENMKLDWGAIAKGYGLDLAFRSLKDKGIKRGFINAGGDLFCWGKNPENSNWKIGVKHPRKKGFLAILAIEDLAAATTGDYQRYFEINGQRYHHVFNPHTGYPAQGKQSVTVIGPQASICDALATALFVSQKPEAIIKKYPDFGALIVYSNGKISIIGRSFNLRFL